MQVANLNLRSPSSPGRADRDDPGLDCARLTRGRRLLQHRLRNALELLLLEPPSARLLLLLLLLLRLLDQLLDLLHGDLLRQLVGPAGRRPRDDELRPAAGLAGRGHHRPLQLGGLRKLLDDASAGGNRRRGRGLLLLLLSLLL